MILTAPVDWYGGTNIYIADTAVQSGNTFKINFIPIRAG